MNVAYRVWICKMIDKIRKHEQLAKELGIEIQVGENVIDENREE